MAQYRISGVWKDEKGVITHYAFHTVTGISVAKGVKRTKVEAIKLLDTQGNAADTRMWDYTKAKWRVGEKVEVVGTGSSKYLRSNPDNKLTDNLGHLINYGTLS